MNFKLVSSFTPGGDQPNAIKKIIQNIQNNYHDQVLLGVTGSGKTFTMANVIAAVGKPTIIMAPNKTLASQLYSEMKAFFPENAVEYFVSYYDYYQPEAYVASTGTYIEKTSSINEEIDRMRHSATRALLEKKDVIVVASVSCIYGLGNVEAYVEMIKNLSVGDKIHPKILAKKLVELQYKRNDMSLERGCFRIKGDILEIFPSHSEHYVWRISFFDDEIESITETDSLTSQKITSLESITIYANSHHVIPQPSLLQAVKRIELDLIKEVADFKREEKLVEMQRLEERTKFDIENLKSTGMCSGIENYSRYLTGKKTGEPPPTLFEYLPKDALLIVDESHISVPQIRGMYRGDFARKSTLVNHGFRLSAALDNRPLKFEEWDRMRPQTLFVSATPGEFELNRTGEIIEQVVRPTGLLDPECFIIPTKGQIDHLIHECQKVIQKGFRILITTLTKKMSESLSEYFIEMGLKVKYLHSEIHTLERIELIRQLRIGEFDILIGINLLREGLDIPECALIAILDADKEGFLRSKSSLIQIIGRAARNSEGKVLLYADKITDSMKEALDETKRRRDKQIQHNKKMGITPKTILKKIAKEEISKRKKYKNTKEIIKEKQQIIRKMKKYMDDLDFENAIIYRDKLKEIEKLLINTTDV